MEADDRWAIFVDIEGFGVRYEARDGDRMVMALGALIEGIHRIGRDVFPEPAERLLAHQLADGVLIVGDRSAPSLEVPVAIAVALLQHVAATGRYAKAAVAEGEFHDFAGCLPDDVSAARDETTGRLRMGRGFLTLLPVIGSAQIRAVRLSGAASGALLLVPRAARRRLPEALTLTEVGEDVLAVDWLHADLPQAREIQRRATLESRSPPIIEQALDAYFRMTPVPPWRWRDATRRTLCLPSDGSG